MSAPNAPQKTSGAGRTAIFPWKARLWVRERNLPNRMFASKRSISKVLPSYNAEVGKRPDLREAFSMGPVRLRRYIKHTSKNSVDMSKTDVNISAAVAGGAMGARLQRKFFPGTAVGAAESGTETDSKTETHDGDASCYDSKHALEQSGADEEVIRGFQHMGL